ncbi:MAG: hypothetical protein HY318_02215, partial [Armatimonadetes bacterium]|nr:hypothetical protein [Armatimonadota bacterium]
CPSYGENACPVGGGTCGLWLSGYGYNYYNFGSQPNCIGTASESQITKPAEALVIADSTYPGYTANKYGYPAIYDPSTGNYVYYADRHNEGLNIGWADGHVKWMRLTDLRGKPQLWYR